MTRLFAIALLPSLLIAAPAFAQEKMGCTEADLKKMEEMAASMPDHKAAMMKHVDLARAELKKGNTAECKKHMDEAHAAMK